MSKALYNFNAAEFAKETRGFFHLIKQELDSIPQYLDLLESLVQISAVNTQAHIHLYFQASKLFMETIKEYLKAANKIREIMGIEDAEICELLDRYKYLWEDDSFTRKVQDIRKASKSDSIGCRVDELENSIQCIKKK